MKPTDMLRALPFFAFSAALLGVPAPATAQETVSYTMQRGATLSGIAQRYFLREGDYRIVQRINSIKNPHRIPVGTRLRIPVDLLRTEPLTARIQALRGTVSLMQAGSSAKPEIGTIVAPGAVLETGNDGFASLVLSNGSQISLPTSSRIRVRTLGRVMLTDTLDFDIAVEKGKVETRATPLPGGNGRFRIRTPRAVAAIRGTVLRVGYVETTENSQAELLEGKVAIIAGDAIESSLAAGFGATISATGNVSTESLLPAPDLESPGQPIASETPALAVRSIAGAAAYHVQIAADAGFTYLVGEATASGPEIALPPLANGRWFARVSAISTTGLEGAAQSYSVRRLLNGAKASAEQKDDHLLFKWTDMGSGERFFRFQMTQNKADAAPMIDEPGLKDTEITLRGIKQGVYFWRIGTMRSAEGEMIETWTPFEKLSVTDTAN